MGSRLKSEDFKLNPYKNTAFIAKGTLVRGKEGWAKSLSMPVNNPKRRSSCPASPMGYFTSNAVQSIESYVKEEEGFFFRVVMRCGWNALVVERLGTMVNGRVVEEEGRECREVMGFPLLNAVQDLP